LTIVRVVGNYKIELTNDTINIDCDDVIDLRSSDDLTQISFKSEPKDPLSSEEYDLEV
jgi:hypothetical protein